MPSIALKSFHIRDYKGIIDTKVENIPSGTQWIFLTGENGFGKTSVLQALANSVHEFYGPKEGFVILEDNKNLIKFELLDKLKNLYLSARAENELLVQQVIGYGSSRLRVSAGSAIEVMEKYSSTESLFSNEALLVNIEENFKDWKTNYPKGYEQLENIFKTLIPRLAKIEVSVDEKSKRNKIEYFELDEQGNILDGCVELTSLAAGYRNILGMIGDMINRLTREAVPEDLSSVEGIVLIDEIELHLHPKYQKLFVEKLTELFPKIQFIVSTHSPIPLLGAPANSVIINVTRTKEEGIQAKLLDIDFSVLTPNTILSSPIFGFQDLIPDSKSNEKMVRTEDTYKEVLFHDQLDKQIDEFLTDDRKQELLDLLKEK